MSKALTSGIGAAASGFASALLLAGCVPDRQSNPLVGVVPPQDPTARRMVLSTDLPRDTDGNGYPDAIATKSYFFEGESGYPLAIPVRGTIRFDLVNHQGKTITSWTFDLAAIEARAMREVAGICYHLDLSLLETGKTDRVDAETVDVRAHFTPSKPEKPKVTGVVSMHFGRTR